LIAVTSVGLLAGCPDRTISEVKPNQGRVESKSFPVDLNRDVDILFLIDNSGSMADKQANLQSNFPNFINVLATIQGGLPNVHIGVATSDMGTKGETVATPGSAVGQVGQGGCANVGDDGKLQVKGGAQVQGLFLSDVSDGAGGRQINYMGGDLATVFGQMAVVGAAGCGFEQHLHGIHRALDPTNATNAGFIRPNAFLAVVILADEDDCSFDDPKILDANDMTLGPQQSFRCTRSGVTCDVGGQDTTAMNQIGVKDQCHPNDSSPFASKISTYVSFLKGLKDDPTHVVVAGIIGPTAPFAVETRTINSQPQPALAHSCTFNGASGTQVADPPIRIQFFLDQFPNRSTSTSICQNDLSGGLQLIGELLKEAIGNPCITGHVLDTDPATPALEPECSVSQITNFGKPNAQETILTECDANGQPSPCWRLKKDTAQCPCAMTDTFCQQNPTANNTNLILDIPGADHSAQIQADCVTEVAND
jgi:hypothetical protein